MKAKQSSQVDNLGQASYVLVVPTLSITARIFPLQIKHNSQESEFMPTITETPHDIQSLKQLKQRFLDVADRIDTNIETMELNGLEVIGVPGYKTMMRAITSIEKHTDDCRQKILEWRDSNGHFVADGEMRPKVKKIKKR